MEKADDILTQIINRKKKIVEEKKLRVDVMMMREKINQHEAPALRSFTEALQNSIKKYGLAIIAELKKASPSKGLISPHYQPTELAKTYSFNKAACLSVLTEEDFFLGCDNDLELARQTCELPVLRKDFIIDSYQIYESRCIGADCILLIASAITESELQEFFALATEIDLDVLVEITNEDELNSALKTGAKLIGINNRNLKDFTVNLEKTANLSKKIPTDKIVICESGITTRSDIEQMQKQGVSVFLIGEALVKAEKPGEKLKEFMGI